MRLGLGALAGAYALVVLFMYASRYYAFGAENLVIHSLVRMARGLPFATRMDELPLYVTTYSPLFLWVAWPGVWLLRALDYLGVGPLVAIGSWARVVSQAFLGVCVWQAWRFARRDFADEIRPSPLAFAAVWLVIAGLIPETLFAARCDSLSFACELGGFIAFWRYEGSRRPRLLALAGALGGVAIAAKLNTLGVALGISLYYLEGRRLREGFGYVAALVATFGAIALGLSIVHGAGVLGETILGGTVNTPLRGAALLSMLQCLLLYFVLPFLPFGLLAYVGTSVIQEASGDASQVQAQAPGRGRGRALTLALACSLGLGFLGQFKYGGTYNYFYGALFLGSVPAAIGLERLAGSRAASREAARAWCALVLGVALVQLALRSLGFASIAANLRHFPYAEMRAYLAREFPNARVYAAGFDDLPNQLAEGLLIEQVGEEFLRESPLLARRLATVKEGVRARGGFGVAVIGTGGCENWKPGGLFSEELAGVTTLRARFGKLCVFGPSAATGSREAKR